MEEWQEWQECQNGWNGGNGKNGGNGRWNGRMAGTEWLTGTNGYMRTLYGTHQ